METINNVPESLELLRSPIQLAIAAMERENFKKVKRENIVKKIKR